MFSPVWVLIKFLWHCCNFLPGCQWCFPVTCNIVTWYVIDNGPFFIFGSLLFNVLWLRFAYFTFTLFMGWYDFAVCFLSLVVVLCHWVGMFWFLSGFWDSLLFLGLLSGIVFALFGVLLFFGYYFAVRVSRLCGFPLASSDIFAFFRVLLLFGLYFCRSRFRVCLAFL